jgi:VanZ family protein
MASIIDRRWAVVLLLFGVLLLYIGLHPNPILFPRLNERHVLGVAGDHWLHFWTFLILSRLVPRVISPFSIAWLVLIALAVGSELLQGICPWRTFDHYDILANSCGLLLGGASVWLMSHRNHSALEQHPMSLV